MAKIEVDVYIVHIGPTHQLLELAGTVADKGETRMVDSGQMWPDGSPVYELKPVYRIASELK